MNFPIMTFREVVKKSGYFTVRLTVRVDHPPPPLLMVSYSLFFWCVQKGTTLAEKNPLGSYYSPGSSMIITVIVNIIMILKIFGAWSFSNILTNLRRSRESTFHRGPAGQKAEEQSDVSDKPFSVKWNIPREREPEKYFKLSLFFSHKVETVVIPWDSIFMRFDK